MNVLSLFDGISAGQLALERAGIPVTNYYAAEIDKYATAITQANFPDTIQLGDVTKYFDWNLPDIDLIIFGSPCQGFSFAGKQLNFDDPRSALFFTAADILDCYKPKHFLMENVKMKQEYRDVISERLGVEPIEINSALVSAQNRRRLYWSNIPYVFHPEDKGILLKDIIETGMIDRDKSFCIDANYFKGGNLKSYFEKHRRQLVFSKDGLCHVGDADLKGNDCIKRVYSAEGKSPTLTTMGGGHREPKILCDGSITFKAKNGKNVIVNDSDLDVPKTVFETRTELGKQSRREARIATGKDTTKRSKEHKQYEVQKHEKANCLVTVDSELRNIIDEKFTYRKLTVIECERLQTFPDNYTNHVSNTQRYKALGNSFTVDVIAHIFGGL